MNSFTEKNKRKVVKQTSFTAYSIFIACCVSAMIAFVVFVLAFGDDRFASIFLQKKTSNTALTQATDIAIASKPNASSQSYGLSASPFGQSQCHESDVNSQTESKCLGNDVYADHDSLTLLALESHVLAGRRELVDEIAGLHNSCILALMLNPRVILNDQCNSANLERSNALIRSALLESIKNSEQSAEKAYVVWLKRNLDLPEIQLNLLERLSDAERKAIDKKYVNSSSLKDSISNQAAELLDFLENKKSLTEEEARLLAKMKKKFETQ
jgi:hypothetical protein